MPSRSHSCAAVVLAASLLFSGASGKAQGQCRFLMPIGGTGEPVVEKRISADLLVGRTNWNTDFAVDRSFSSYRVKLQSASTLVSKIRAGARGPGTVLITSPRHHPPLPGSPG